VNSRPASWRRADDRNVGPSWSRANGSGGGASWSSGGSSRGATTWSSRVAASGRVSSALANSHINGAAAEVSLSRQDLIVLSAQVQAERGPGVEVVASGDGALGALVRTDRPVLLEGRGALNGRSVCAGGGQNAVGRAVRFDGSELAGTAAWVVGPEVLHDLLVVVSNRNTVRW